MKAMSIGATVTFILAVFVGTSPAVFATSEQGDGGFVWILIFIPLAAVLGSVALVLALIVSIMGIARARGTSTARLVVAVAALVLMVFPVGIYLAIAFFDDVADIWFLMVPGAGLIGFILAIMTGFLAAPKGTASELITG